MSDESRAAMEEAWDAAEADAEEEEVDGTGAADEGDEIEGEVADEGAGEPGEAGDDGEPSEEESGEPGSDPAAAAAADAGEESNESEPAAETRSAAPSSWSPQAREAWGTVPEEARAEIERREREIDKTLNDTASDRREAERLRQAVKPFEQTLALEAGGDPVAATANLLGVATRLRFGTQQEKAALVSQLVNTYGVDIESLDHALAGSVSPPGAGAGNPPPGNPIPAPGSDPRIDAMWRDRETQTQQTAHQQQQEVNTFLADPKNEFANDVRNEMADIIELNNRRGSQLTLQQAYDQAVVLSPNVQAVLTQRGGAPAAGAGNGAPAADLRSKKRAAKSVKGSPSTGASKAEPTSREDQLRAAWDANE